MKELKVWKKVLESDLSYVIDEVKDELETPAVLILTGDVGVGKTTFTKYFLENQSYGASPSYSLINEYKNSVHADFYRIKTREEVLHLEMSLYLDNKDYFMVEWGKSFLNEIYREVGDSFKYYELIISSNGPSSKESHSTRNYQLNSLSIF